VHAYDAGRWLLLAILWSLQYLFLRVAVPVFGAEPAAAARALLSAAFLVPWVLFFARLRIGPIEHWRDYLAVGVVNNVLPFVCISYAALKLPASYMAIMNGLVPLWTAVIAAPVLGERLGIFRVAGFVLGIAGVALIVNLGPVELNAGILLGAAAAVAGTALWGWAAVMIKQRYGRIAPMALAAGSAAFAGLIMTPLLAGTPAPSAWTLEAAAALAALGLFCAGVAYLPFFTLVRDIGPSRTLTVGLTVPALGTLWGWLLLGEAVTWSMVAGTALVLVALALVLGK
jgi:drug/metabolite transporter (DMT)-like permease